MIYGSHNTMTYLKPRHWWMRLFSFCAKCQKNDIETQLENGVKVIDIRLKWKLEKFIFAHGLYELKVSDLYLGANLTAEQFIYCLLQHLTLRPGQYYLRMTLESLKEDEEAEKQFRRVCKNIEEHPAVVVEGKVIPFGGTRKFDWKIIHLFKDNPYYEQYVGSMQSTYGKIWPWLWYKFNHKKSLLACSQKECICLFDFV